MRVPPFATYRRTVLYISLALGLFVLLVVPLYNATVADADVLASEGYLEPACRWPISVLPEPLCPFLFAGESPMTVVLSLVVVPLLMIRPGARTMLAVAAGGLAFALFQIVSAFYATFPSALDPGYRPSPFERESGCGLVLCGLDHTLFHFAHLPFVLAITYFGYRAYRATG